MPEHTVKENQAIESPLMKLDSSPLLHTLAQKRICVRKHKMTPEVQVL